MSDLQREISRRRTFAIISHPDAGKTTLTEKFLLYGGAIQLAGSVKGQEDGPRTLSPTGWRLRSSAASPSRSSVLQFELRRLLHQHPRHPRPPGLLRGHLPHADGRRLGRHGHRRGQGRRGRRPASSSRSASCGTSRFSLSSTRWTARRATRSICSKRSKRSSASAPYPVNWPIGCGKDFKGRL